MGVRFTSTCVGCISYKPATYSIYETYMIVLGWVLGDATNTGHNTGHLRCISHELTSNNPELHLYQSCNLMKPRSTPDVLLLHISNYKILQDLTTGCISLEHDSLLFAGVELLYIACDSIEIYVYRYFFDNCCPVRHITGCISCEACVCCVEMKSIGDGIINE